VPSDGYDAVIDYVPEESFAASSARAPSANDAKLDRLEAQLEQMRAMLSAHETTLNASEQRFGRTAQEVSSQTVERELAKAGSDWDAEQDRRMAAAAAAAAANLEQSRDNWQAELDARLAQSEEFARKELAESRERWRREMQVTLTKAERAWKAEESARLAVAEAEWRKQSGVTSAAARANADEIAARERAETEVQRLREKLSEALANMAEREAALAQAQVDAGRVREIALRERDVALREAQKSWKAEEAKRFNDAEKRWREETESLGAELLARCERAEAALAGARAESRERDGLALADAENARDQAERDLSNVKVQLSALTKALSDREAEIARVNQAADKAKERMKLEHDVMLERAQAAWKSEAAARLAAAKALWHQESANSLASAHGEAEALRDQHVAELRRVQKALSQTQAALAERDAELARARAEAEETNERLQQEANAQLVGAQRAWKAEEAARLSAAKAEWNKQSTNALSEATARYQAAETALARLRSKTEDELRRGTHDDGDSDHLRQQIVLLQAALAKCERELAHMKSGAAFQDYPSAVAARPAIKPIGNQTFDELSANTRDEGERRPFISWALLREAIALAGLVAAIVLSFPYWVVYLPDEWQAEIVSFLGPAPAPPPPKAPHQPAPKIAVAPLHLEAVIHSAKLRSAPSPSADVVSTLGDGDEVNAIEQNGDWTHVRITPKGGAPIDGWVYSSRLKDESPATTPAKEP